MRQNTLLLFLSCLPLFIFRMKPVSEFNPVDYRIKNTSVIDTNPSIESRGETESLDIEK